MNFRDKLALSSGRHASKVVLALDLRGAPASRYGRAQVLIEELGEQVAGVKVNLHLLLPRGLEGLAPLVERCSSKGLPLIADIKLNDIESTNLEAVDLLFGGGFDAVIANPFVGLDEGLSQVLASAHRREKGILLLVYMSHKGAREGYGLKVGREPLYLRFARRTRDWGADGAIVSAMSLPVLRRVRKILKKEQVILSPGVGVQGGSAYEAMGAGADYAIVGRSIVEADDPVGVLRTFNRSSTPSAR